MPPDRTRPSNEEPKKVRALTGITLMDKINKSTLL